MTTRLADHKRNYVRLRESISRKQYEVGFRLRRISQKYYEEYRHMIKIVFRGINQIIKEIEAVMDGKHPDTFFKLKKYLSGRLRTLNNFLSESLKANTIGRKAA